MEQGKDKITIENSSSILDERDEITKADRSHLVREHDFGRIASANAQSRDIPVYAIIEYDKSGQIVFEDYSKLDALLYKVITTNIKETHIKNPVTNQREIAKTLQGNVLTKLKLSEKEMEYAIMYLSERNILVRGIDSSLDNELENYQFISTYKSEPLPPALTSDENTKLFVKLEELKKELLRATEEKQKLLLEKEIYKIRNKLIEGNMRLVNYIMYKQIPSAFSDMDKEDLSQIGYEVLIEFIDKYDVNAGYALSTGLFNYLMYHVWKNYNNLNQVRIPVHIQEKIRKILKVKNVIEPVLQREATVEEIAGELYLSVKDVEEALRLYNSQNMESIESFNSQSQADEQSYDYPLEDEEIEEEQFSNGLLDSLPELIVENSELRSKILEVLNTLTEREAEVLRFRYGFFDNKTYSLDEVGEIFGVTRERIRQIENKAIRKLRHPSRSKKIIGFYLDNDTDDRYTIDSPKQK